ncbi:hypothetical protein D7X33_19355, partial [Butyricicoccus sp. 1XD8-22]
TTLIFAEKPSVAQAYAEALVPKHIRRDGYIESIDGKTIITYGYGHLVQLKPPGLQNPEWDEWRWDTLPMIPKKIQLQAIDDPGVKKQLKIIKTLSDKADIIVNGGDAALEGSLIFLYITLYLGIKKPTYRLWTSSFQPDAIRKAYKEMKPASAYKSFEEAAVCRSLSDWIVGLNATRALSLASAGQAQSDDDSEEEDKEYRANKLKKGQLLNAGRIMTPTLALVYDRHIERTAFKKLKYYPIFATFNQNQVTYSGYWEGEKITNSEKSKAIANQIKGKQGMITDIQESDKQTPPPL